VSESDPPHPGAISFRAVFEQHARYVWRCLRGLGVPAADVEDLCQEVFVVVSRKLSQLDSPASVRSWLYGICLRKVWDYRRLAHKKREYITEEIPDQPVAASQSDDLDRRAARAFLESALAKLDPKQRDVFVLYEIEQLTMAEIAAAVDCPLQTAYSRLHKAREQVEAACQRARARRLSP